MPGALTTSPYLKNASTLASGFEASSLSREEGFVALEIAQGLLENSGGETDLIDLIQAYKQAVVLGNGALRRALEPIIAQIIRERSLKLDQLLKQLPQQPTEVSLFGDFNPATLPLFSRPPTLFLDGSGSPRSTQTRSASPRLSLKEEVFAFLQHLVQQAPIADVELLNEVWEAAKAGSLAGLWNNLNLLPKIGILFPGRDHQTQVIYWHTLKKEERFMALRARVASEILGLTQREGIDIPTKDKTALTEAVEEYREYAKAKRRKERASQERKATDQDVKQALVKRLARLGVFVQGDSVRSLERLLQSAQDQPSEKKERLIADFLATLGWYPPYGPIFKKFLRHNSGKKIELPHTFQFFDRHYQQMGHYREALDPQGVLRLLKTLVYPDTLRMAAYYQKMGFHYGTIPGVTLPEDPVELEGYEEAVKELLTKVRELRRAGILKDEDLKPLPMSSPESAIPISELTPALRREYRRLFGRESFRKKIEAAVYAYRYHDRFQQSPAHNERLVEDGYRATFGQLYAQQTRGNQPTAQSMKALDPKKGDPEVLGGRQSRREQWLFSMGGVGDPADIRKGGRNKLDELGNLGRFYFAVRWEYRRLFWRKLTKLMETATKASVAFQTKITLNQFHVDTGDNAVLYFRSGLENYDFDQKFMYNAVVKMMAECPAKWFHDETSRPILAAQVYDPTGRKIVGLSFMQDPIEEHSSGNGIRAEAHATGIRNARLLRILGAPVENEMEKLLMAIALLEAHIDPEHPAFNLTTEGQPTPGKDLFGFIRARTDQADK